MAVKFPEYLLAFYEWLRLSSMPEGAVARFNDIEKNENLTKDMKSWAEKMESFGGKIGEKTPMPNALRRMSAFYLGDDDTEWEKLYRIFQTAFMEMNVNRDKLQDTPKVIAYLDTAFGPGKAFGPQELSPETEMAISTLVNFLQTPEGATIGSQKGVENFPDFLQKLVDGKYRNDPNVQKQLQQFSYTLSYQASALVQQFPQITGYLNMINFNQIRTGFDDASLPIPTYRLDMFKMVYPGLLKPLLTTEDIRNAFAGTSKGSKITDVIAKAIKNTDYDNKDGKNYLVPKLADEKTPWQKFKGSINDALDDTILKLKDRAHYHKFMMAATAKPMTIAIYDIGFKPTDGLAKVLEKAGDIKGKLASMPEANAHFNFLIEALNYVKDGGAKNAFGNALRNGWQLNAVVAEIAKYAIEKGKVNEAKSALETLAQLRFGYTTAIARADLEKVNFVGLQNLSFAKEGFMKDIFKGLDWGINKSIMGIYEFGNLGNNLLRRRGTLFREAGDRTKKIMETLAESSKAGKEEKKQERLALSRELRELNAQKTTQEGITAGLDEAYLNTAKTTIEDQIKLRYDAVMHRNAELQQVKEDLQLDIGDRATNIGRKGLLEYELQNINDDIDILKEGLKIVYERLQEFTKLESIKGSIKEAKAVRREVNKEVREWDDSHQNQMAELMAFWNFVNKQNNFNPFISQKAAQKNFDANKATMFTNYKASHDFAA